MVSEREKLMEEKMDTLYPCIVTFKEEKEEEEVVEEEGEEEVVEEGKEVEEVEVKEEVEEEVEEEGVKEEGTGRRRWRRRR